jgi:hypothetical protein
MRFLGHCLLLLLLRLNTMRELALIPFLALALIREKRAGDVRLVVVAA